MSKKKYDEQLAAIEALSEAGTSPETTAALKKALALRNNYLVSRAAKVTAALNLADLIGDILKALQRFYKDPVKTDPQCWAKNELTAALIELGYREAAPYLSGLHHQQLEAVWGGRSDTAGNLRSRCALVLVECRELDDVTLLEHLVEALVDPEPSVRTSAARAVRSADIAMVGPLLRLRAHTADEESDTELLAACFAGLLSLEGEPAIPFVARWLSGPSVPEAALALGETRDPQVVPLLSRALRAAKEEPVIAAILSALALTNLPEALELVLERIEQDSADAPAAIDAMRAAHMTEELFLRMEHAAETSGNLRLQQRVEPFRPTRN